MGPEGREGGRRVAVGWVCSDVGECWKMLGSAEEGARESEAGLVLRA